MLPNSIKASLLSRMSMHFLLKTTYTNNHNALIIIRTLSYMNDCHFNISKIAPWQLFCNSVWQKYCYLYNCLKHICSYHLFILATHKGNEQFHNCPWYHDLIVIKLSILIYNQWSLLLLTLYCLIHNTHTHIHTLSWTLMPEVSSQTHFPMCLPFILIYWPH